MVAAAFRPDRAQVAGPKKIKLSAAKPTATRWRIMPLPGSRSRMDFFRRFVADAHDAEGCCGVLGGRRAGHAVRDRTSRRVAYRGTLRAIKGDTVNILPLDDYLKGVVPREVPASWKPAAVQAQAVAARTYAAFGRREPQASHYQICDTTACQVYGGYSDEETASNTAIAATAGQILTSGGLPAFTQFSASNGGWTSPGGFPYLPAKADPFDTVFRTGWTATVTAARWRRPARARHLPAAEVTRDGNGQWDRAG